MKINYLTFIAIIAIFASCNGSSKQKSENNESENVANSQELDEKSANGVPYITLSTSKNVGDGFGLHVSYPKDSLVWLDLNDNGKFDEGEKLPITDYKVEYNTVYEEGGDGGCCNTTVKKQEMKIYGPVEYLFSGASDVTKIDISHNPYLVELYINENKLKNIDISKNLNLKTLFIPYNDISELDISKNQELDVLCCEGNLLTDLDISKNDKLEVLCLNARDVERDLMKTPLFDFERGWRKLWNDLKDQDLAPEGWHIIDLVNNGNLVGDDKDDLVLILEENIPYADIEYRDMNITKKLMAFEQIADGKYKLAGEYDNCGYSDEIIIKPNIIVLWIYESIESHDEITFRVKDGKITNITTNP